MLIKNTKKKNNDNVIAKSMLFFIRYEHKIQWNQIQHNYIWYIPRYTCVLWLIWSWVIGMDSWRTFHHFNIDKTCHNLHYSLPDFAVDKMFMNVYLFRCVCVCVSVTELSKHTHTQNVSNAHKHFANFEVPFSIRVFFFVCFVFFFWFYNVHSLWTLLVKRHLI